MFRSSGIPCARHGWIGSAHSGWLRRPSTRWLWGGQTSDLDRTGPLRSTAPLAFRCPPADALRECSGRSRLGLGAAWDEPGRTVASYGMRRRTSRGRAPRRARSPTRPVVRPGSRRRLPDPTQLNGESVCDSSGDGQKPRLMPSRQIKLVSVDGPWRFCGLSVGLIMVCAPGSSLYIY